jgi:hypothetical protein
MTSGYLFYGDLNCPFCYAQNERLHDLDVHATVEWRGIRHTPRVAIPPSPTAAELEELEGEVKRLVAREPDLRIVTPPARPNSEPATLLVAAAIRADPVRAATLRTMLYRALWVFSRDISDLHVLEEFRRAAGLPRLCVGTAERWMADAWQREWEHGDFDRRLPSMVSPRGARLLGLSERRRVEAFLKSGLLSSESDDACR